MKKENILDLFERFEKLQEQLKVWECWSAREMQQLLRYTKWENFLKVIDKAKDACDTAGEQIKDHFPEVRKVITAGKGAQQIIEDIALTRYACDVKDTFFIWNFTSCTHILEMIVENDFDDIKWRDWQTTKNYAIQKENS